MKTLNLCGLAILTLLFFVSCEKTVEEPVTDDAVISDAPLEKSGWGNAGGNYYGTFFSATARTSGAENPDDPNGCAPFNVDQRGSGSAFKYGSFNVQFTFCVDPSTAGQGYIRYFNAKGTFYLDNGDEIYGEGGGRVIFNPPGTVPSAFFKDTFYFTGAKINGVHKRASGFFQTDSQVFNIGTPDEYTEHKFVGSLRILD